MDTDTQKTETVRDIIAEMQREAAEYSQKSDSITCGVYSICITDYANRLDAALARDTSGTRRTGDARSRRGSSPRRKEARNEFPQDS